MFVRQGFFTTQEVCDILHVQRSTFVGWERSGVFPTPERGHHGFTERREIPFSSLQKMAKHRLKWFNAYWGKIYKGKKWPQDSIIQKLWLESLAGLSREKELAEAVEIEPLLVSQTKVMLKVAIRLKPGQKLRVAIWSLLLMSDLKVAMK